MGFDVVERVKVFQHVLEHFLTFPADALWTVQKALVSTFAHFEIGAANGWLTFLHVEAGDVSGGFLVVGWQPFFMLRSLSVLLSSLSPSGSTATHKHNRRVINSNQLMHESHNYIWIIVNILSELPTVGLLFPLSSAGDCVLDMLHGLDQMSLN